MTTCPQGHKNPVGHRFCGECGALIQSESEDKPNAGHTAFRLVTADIELPGKSGILLRTTFVPLDDEAPPVGSQKADAPSPKSGIVSSRLRGLVFGAAIVLVLMVGCTVAVIHHNDNARRSKSSITTSVASPAALPRNTVTLQPAPAPTTTTPLRLTSTLLGLAMPPGSRLTRGVTSNGDEREEDWESGTNFDQTVSALRPQLPLGEPLEGVLWCKEDFYQPTRMLSWVWGDAPGTPWIDVEINPKIGNPTQAVVFITVESHSAGGCGP